MDRVVIFLLLFLLTQVLGGICYRVNYYRLSVLAINFRAVLYILISKKGARLLPSELNRMDSSSVRSFRFFYTGCLYCLLERFICVYVLKNFGLR